MFLATPVETFGGTHMIVVMNKVHFPLKSIFFQTFVIISVRLL